MLVHHDYPICEYDTSRNPIIKPTDFFEEMSARKVCDYFFQKRT